MQQPSVDRALLRNCNPEAAKLSQNDGIICLLAKEVRDEKIIINNPQDVTEYKLDVKPDPLQNNAAHAIIVSSPPYKNKNAFEKTKIKLAFLASKRGWLIEPQETNG